MLPVDASIGDTDATLQAGGTLGRNLLVARTDVGLDHDTNNGALTFPDLVGNDLGNLGLVVVVFLGVACGPVSQPILIEYLSMQIKTYRESSQP